MSIFDTTNYLSAFRDDSYPVRDQNAMPCHSPFESKIQKQKTIAIYDARALAFGLNAPFDLYRFYERPCWRTDLRHTLTIAHGYNSHNTSRD